ncbi:MAG TPA: hypothetical protein VEW71_07370 [Allosphingosinicella sp.]|nr:hypothetical protein [Allosphingosinicella sp.]
MTVTPTGSSSSSPSVTVEGDQTVTQTMNIATEFPSLLAGNDGALADSPCVVSFDVGMPLPSVNAPSGLFPGKVPFPVPNPAQAANLPPISFSPPLACLQAQASIACGAPLDCRLPFCGRDIIFVHGLITTELEDLIRANHNLGGSNAQNALIPWPQGAAAFTSPTGYFRKLALLTWSNFLRLKLAPAYQAAGASQGPRFLVVAWPAGQRMEFGVHATLSQISTAMQTGAGVMTINPNQAATGAVSANLQKQGFCGRGCVIVSYSTGGPIAIAAMNMAAHDSRPWTTGSLRALPTFIKGHVALHPALGGAQVAQHVIAAANTVGPACPAAVALLNAWSTSNWVPTAVAPCVALQELNPTILYDLAPPSMNGLWRPIMAMGGPSVSTTVPTLVVAGAHPTSNAVIHWQAQSLPGYDDGVVTVDSQLGRPWLPAAMPRTLSFGQWGLFGAHYYDRGAPTAKAVPYFIDQNHELATRPATHAAAPNPYLAPNGMVLPAVGLSEIPFGSSGITNVFSFLQSTSNHMFPESVGVGPDSQPNESGHGCPGGTYSYRPTGNYFGSQASVQEESRAVFDSSVYTTRGRNHFAPVEAATGAIPLLSYNLAGAIEGEQKGRYIRIRFTILWFTFSRTFWIWKRDYVRMRDWRCRDEIDYTLEFAFRR